MTTTYAVPGLESSVEILIDRWGVPHLYAESRDDVFVAQGFNAARDRLFQMDLWRRRGLGLLSEVFGAAYVEHDRAARLFLYRGDMRAEWLAYGADTERVTSAFVGGVNAFVALCRDDPAHLPPEFAELGYLPARWEPSDVARIRSHGLFYNLEQEVARALTLRDHGAAVEDLRRVREPGRPELRVPDGLDLGVIPDDVLRVYHLATAPPDLGPRSGLDGSNNWVIAPSRTATGRPLLANDPHRAVTLPSLRYLAHLSAPGLDVIGAGEPVLPGISIGHNGRIAFGLTIFPIDQEDLYVYRTDPADRHAYEYRGRWEPMERVRETIPVRDGEPVETDLWFTRHGPVIAERPDRDAAFAVRAAWLEPGMAPYLGSMDYMNASGADEFVAAMRRWGAPGENQVYAATDGTVGWRPAGRVPRRPNWDGTLPVPGDGRYEWDGFHDVEELPSVRDPEQGWFATANQMNLPEAQGRPVPHVTFDWYAPYRHQRIAEELGSRTGWTVAACLRLQTDQVSMPARHLLPLLDALRADGLGAGDVRAGDVRAGGVRAGDEPTGDGGTGDTRDDERVATALALLRDWDATLAPDSAAAALYEVWYRRHLRLAVLDAALARLVPPDRRADALARLLPAEDLSGDARVDLDLLLSPGDRLGPDPAGTLRSILRRTLAAAMAEVEGLLGEDTGTWAWGRLHQAEPRHPLAGRLGNRLRDRLGDSLRDRLGDPLSDRLREPGWTSVGPAPRGGSGDTVGSTPYTPDFRQTGGATFRLVVDVGSWDDSVAMNSPGQSGVPGSPHHHDLFDAWAADEAFPLLYTREAVERAVAERIVLRPG